MEGDDKDRLGVSGHGGDLVHAEGSWIRSVQGRNEDIKGAMSCGGIHGGSDGARLWSGGSRNGASSWGGDASLWGGDTSSWSCGGITPFGGAARPISCGGGGGASSWGRGTSPCGGGASSWGGGASRWSGDSWPNSLSSSGGGSSSSLSTTGGVSFGSGRHRRCQQRRFPGRESRRGSSWDVRSHRLVVEGVDFAQDTQEGGADEYMFIPDSDDEGFQGIICTDDGEFVPETEPHDVGPMDDNEGDISNQHAHRPKVDPPSVMGTANQDIVKSKETIPMNLAGHLQEREYEVMDDFQLQMIRLVFPGYVPWAKEEFNAMTNYSRVEQMKLEKAKENELEMHMDLAADSQEEGMESEEEMHMDLAADSQEEEYEPLDESQLKLYQLQQYYSSTQVGAFSNSTTFSYS